jgi:hypothetical protein
MRGDPWKALIEASEIVAGNDVAVPWKKSLPFALPAPTCWLG